VWQQSEQQQQQQQIFAAAAGAAAVVRPRQEHSKQQLCPLRFFDRPCWLQKLGKQCLTLCKQWLWSTATGSYMCIWSAAGQGLGGVQKLAGPIRDYVMALQSRDVPPMPDC
jgi:hypothetical protein